MASLSATNVTAALDDPVETTAPLEAEVPPDPLHPACRIGERVGGRYRVERVLARGGMAEVYVATDLELQRAVALKLASGDPLHSRRASERLLREARLMASLHHVNIAAVHDHGRTAHGAAFVVLELIAGPTLRDFIARSATLSWHTTIAIATQIAQGLSAAHARGIVHCDLSPANVLLARADRNGLLCKLIDFGIACHPSEPRGPPLHGTRSYLAPEARDGGAPDARLDLYALGVILGELLAKTKPAPAALASLTLALKAEDPRVRPASAAAVVEALRRIGRHGDRAAPAPGPPAARTSSRLAWAVVGGVALLALGAPIAVVELGRGPADEAAPVPRDAPPPVRAGLQPIPLRVPSKTPEVTAPGSSASAAAIRTKPAGSRPAARRTSPRTALADALHRRGEVARQAGIAGSAEPAISFDPTGHSARVVYPLPDAPRGQPREVVEYWVFLDGDWRPLEGD